MSDKLAERIKHLRAEQGLTLEEVAKKVGVGKSTVRKWETGMIANMKRDKIALLADALNTTPEYLMGWTEKEPAEADPRIDMIYNLLKNMSDDNLMKLLDYARWLISQQNQ